MECRSLAEPPPRTRIGAGALDLGREFGELDGYGNDRLVSTTAPNGTPEPRAHGPNSVANLSRFAPARTVPNLIDHGASGARQNSRPIT
jgi:hypothetical protein